MIGGYSIQYLFLTKIFVTSGGSSAEVCAMPISRYDVANLLFGNSLISSNITCSLSSPYPGTQAESIIMLIRRFWLYFYDNNVF